MWTHQIRKRNAWGSLLALSLVSCTAYAFLGPSSLQHKKVLASGTFFRPQTTFKRPVISDVSISEEVIDKKLELTENESATSQKFDFAKAWYPIAVEDGTSKTKPQAFQFLGNDVVLWYSEEGWRLFEDSCPHRGVPLSEGRIEKEGDLLCSYHAWRFDHSGKCTSMPQAKEELREEVTSNIRACVKSYPIQVEQGLIWAWGSSGTPGSDTSVEATLKPRRLIEEIYDQELTDRVTVAHFTQRDLPYGWDMFIENVLDPAHVPVSHHNIVGDRYKDPRHIGIEFIKNGTEVLEGYPQDTGFKHKILGMESLSSSVTTTNDFRPPCLVKITSEFEKGAKSILVLYATPTKPGYCRHIGTQVFVSDEEGNAPSGLGVFAKLPKWLLHISGAFFLHQDQIFLHNQERMLYGSSNYAFGDFSANPALASSLTSNPAAYASTYHMPNSQDRQITKFRKWVHEKASGGVKWGAASLVNGLPKRLPPSQLFDTYEAHTKNCEICQQSLGRILKLRNMFGVLAAGCAILVNAKLRALCLTGLFSAVSMALHKLSKLYFKLEFSHQDNN
mmetsp:Transcript_22198/g.28788  ORF Transcript_22198/g.28788 Transcript_22198/m.28788 type:complete len:560 (-) Transcript_22198:129-1808(-)